MKSTKKNKLMAGILAAMLAMGIAAGGQAASRAEVAAIHVERAADFQYWNDNSPTKNKIVNFVESAVDPQSPNFIPEEDRIAVFDMDGTFYCETAPLYFQETMFLHRALEDKSYEASRHEVRDETWTHRGEGAKRAADYLMEKYAALTKEPEEEKSTD